MKPTIQITDKNNRRSLCRTRPGFISPKTDYSFQPTAADSSARCKGNQAASFRGISKDYFNREARSHFVAESALFAVIMMTAAVPVIESVRGLAQFVYGVL